MSILIGLTGPTGAGKSLAATVAADKGIQVIDCDLVAREAVVKGSVGLEALVKTFGGDILESDGSLDRKRLAEKAFSSRENTELLNSTLLPYIVDLVKQKIKGEKVLLDAPTLFESGLNPECDYTIAVLAQDDIRLERIMKRDLITKEQAELRMSAGKPEDFYINKADYVIYNNDDDETFKNEFLNIINNKR